MKRLAIIVLTALVLLLASCAEKVPEVVYLDMSETAVALLYNSGRCILYVVELPAQRIAASDMQSQMEDRFEAYCGLECDIYRPVLARDGRAAIELLGLLSKTGDADNINTLLGVDLTALAERMKRDEAQVESVDAYAAVEEIQDDALAQTYTALLVEQLRGGNR